MQFSDTSTLQGLLQDIDFRCSSSSTRYLTADKVRNINNEYDKVIEFMTRNGTNIKWADSDNETAPYNFTDYNVASGTATIEITKPFRFQRAEITDGAGKISEVTLISSDDIEGAIQNYQTTTGTPKEMTIDGDSATLYPTPNFTVTGGLRVYGQDEPTLFAAANTTELPQLPRFVHSLLSIGASLHYCNIYKKDRVASLIIEKRELETRFSDYLRTRDKIKSRIQPRIEDNE